MKIEKRFRKRIKLLKDAMKKDRDEWLSRRLKWIAEWEKYQKKKGDK